MRDQELVEVNHEIERINDRVKSIESITSTIENLAEQGVESWGKYLEKKDEREKRESELEALQHQRELEQEDKAHKRSIVLLTLCIGSVVLLILVAMLMNQNDLVSIILTSSLAVGSGAGITSMFKKSKSEK